MSKLVKNKNKNQKKYLIYCVLKRKHHQQQCDNDSLDESGHAHEGNDIRQHKRTAHNRRLSNMKRVLMIDCMMGSSD